jgi:hypothetical protein
MASKKQRDVDSDRDSDEEEPEQKKPRKKAARVAVGKAPVVSLPSNAIRFNEDEDDAVEVKVKAANKQSREGFVRGIDAAISRTISSLSLSSGLFARLGKVGRSTPSTTPTRPFYNGMHISHLSWQLASSSTITTADDVHIIDIVACMLSPSTLLSVLLIINKQMRHVLRASPILWRQLAINTW